MRSMAAPVVPMTFASTAPIASIVMLASGVPDSEPFTSMPPAMTKSEVSSTMKET